MSPISIRICVQYLVAVRRSCREKRGYCGTCVVLKYYGISPQALNWVHSFLTNRTQQVLLEGNMSSSINVTSGVPQGSVLGPLLFLIYINDLPDYIQNNSTVKLFADDTIIYHPINNQQDSVALQEDLNSLQRWESDWLMHFHPQKCQTMHITNKRNIIQSTYTIHNHKLQTTNTAKYLGIHTHSTLNWNTHINKTTQRANTTSAFLHRNIRTCPRKTKHLTKLTQTSSSHLRICQHHLGSTYSLQYQQT